MAQLIQYIISDKSDCADKIEYLRRVANRLDEHIALSKNDIENQKSRINVAQDELSRLEREKEELVEEIARVRSQDKESLRNMEK